MTRLVLFVLLIFFSCVSQDKAQKFTVKHYSALDEKIRITGRVVKNDSITIFWSGTSIKLKFKGNYVKAFLRDEKGKNYFNIVIDEDSVSYIKLDSGKHYYTIASGLGDGEHTVELIKRNEWETGKSWFYGVQVTDGELLSPSQERAKVIEYYGDSITAGYAIDDNTGGDSPDSIYTNSYYTYGAITGRHFKTDNYYTVKSGIGITISWFPLIMPEMYNRVDPTDSLSRWDFKQVTPDLVIINLFQNDSWLVLQPEHESFKQRFGTTAPDKRQLVNAYKDFVKSIRTEYPNTPIICALGSMDATKAGSPWPGYVTTATKELNDQNIYTLFFPYMNKGGHPRRADNVVMANILIKFIEDKKLLN
jgi:hypothetical protein